MIHKSAIISPEVELGSNVEVSPYAVLDGNIRIGDNCRIGPHAFISGNTVIGENTRIHAGAVIGDEPQDYHYQGARTYTEIGSNCIIREYVTVHRGTDPETTTVIGDNVMLMAFAHIAHNCSIGDNVVIANNTILGGYVSVAERAFLSASLLIHQFVKIGTIAMIGGGGRVTQDVPPFVSLVLGKVHGPNTVGLKRAGFDAGTRSAVRGALKLLYFSDLNRSNAMKEIDAQFGDNDKVKELVDFINQSERGIMPGVRQVQRRSAEKTQRGTTA